MSPTPPDELLSAYLDGELSAEERAHVERLLSENSDARQAVEEFRALSGELGGLPRHKLDGGFADRVLRQAERAMLEAPPPPVAAAPHSPQDGRPTAASRAPRPSVERLDDAPGWPRRLIRPAAYAVLTLAAALLLMFFLDDNVPLPLARREAADRGAPAGAAGEGVASTPGGPSEISAIPGIEKGVGSNGRPMPRAARTPDFATANEPPDGPTQLAAGIAGGFGAGGGAARADDRVYHVAVAAEAADLAAIEKLFDDHSVAVVEDDKTESVSSSLMRKLAQGSVVEEDNVVELQQLAAAPEGEMETLELESRSDSRGAVVPESVAYLVEATPEQIEEIVAAIGASGANGQQAAQFRLVEAPFGEERQRRAADEQSDVAPRGAALREEAGADAASTGLRADDVPPRPDPEPVAGAGQPPSARAETRPEAVVAEADDPHAGAARNTAQVAKARRYIFPPEVLDPPPDEDVAQRESPPAPAPTEPNPAPAEQPSDEAPPAPVAEYAEGVERDDLLSEEAEALRENADEDRRDQGKQFAEERLDAERQFDADGQPGVDGQAGATGERQNFVRAWFVFRVAPPELAAPEEPPPDPLPAGPAREPPPEQAPEPPPP